MRFRRAERLAPPRRAEAPKSYLSARGKRGWDADKLNRSRPGPYTGAELEGMPCTAEGKAQASMPLRLAPYPVMVKAMPLLVHVGTLPTSDLPGGHRSLRGGNHWSPSSSDPHQILARAERIAVSKVGLQGIRRYLDRPLGWGSWLVANQNVLGHTARHGASGVRQILTIAELVAMAQVTVQICTRHGHRLFCWAARFVADDHPRACASRLSRNISGCQVTA